MKAAIINQFGDTPMYEDFKDPIPKKGDELIQVKAVVLENFDKLTASGKHFASKSMFPEFPAIAGHSGVGTLENGDLVTFGGILPPFGTMAEKAVVLKKYLSYIQKVPKGISPSIAASLPAAALTSYLTLKYSANFQKGQSVLINGATGVSGKLGVQIAKLLGASRVIGTGRNTNEMKKLFEIGVDDYIQLDQSEERIYSDLNKTLGNGIDVILDFVWGKPTELILKALTPKQVGIPEQKIQLIQIGQSAGESIQLNAEMLRTSGVEIKGVGKIERDNILESTQQIWDWIASEKLNIEIEEVPLKDISSAWEKEVKGKRIVIIP